MSVAVVVVSFNRKALLRKCLSAINSQQPAADEVIVIDNGSTDGSPDVIRNEYPEVTLFETGANLGGAGGFAWGVEIAIAKGHDWAWLMDDDAEPAPDSLAPLVQVAETPGLNPGLVTSLISGPRGSGVDYPPQLEIDPRTSHQLRAKELGCIAIRQATFVGVLINLHFGRTMPLPCRDFFIWMDDLDYTRRLTNRGIGLLVPSSVIYHPVKTSTEDMGKRLFYFIRNGLWISKLKINDGLLSQPGLAAVFYLIVALRQFPKAKNKRIWLNASIRGLWQGITRRPTREMPGTLLVESGRKVPDEPAGH